MEHWKETFLGDPPIISGPLSGCTFQLPERTTGCLLLFSVSQTINEEFLVQYTSWARVVFSCQASHPASFGNSILNSGHLPASPSLFQAVWSTWRSFCVWGVGTDPSLPNGSRISWAHWSAYTWEDGSINTLSLGSFLQRLLLKRHSLSFWEHRP